MDKQLCPLCEEGRLTEHCDRVVHTTSFGYKGEVKNHYSICNECGVVQVNMAQSKLNKQEIISFRERARLNCLVGGSW
jgi:C4-type Zn-finger protein